MNASDLTIWAERRLWTKCAVMLTKLKMSKAIPTSLGIAVTSACNITCRYCMRTKFKPPKGMITVDHMRYIAKKMPYIRNICIMGLCEPLLNPHLADLLFFMNDEAKFEGISLTTNGTVDITPRMLEAFTRVSDMVFSIDTANSQTFKFLRGATLDTVMSNFRKVVDYKREHGLGRTDNPPIHINAVITRQNFFEIPGLIRMLEPYSDMLTYLMVDPVSRPDYQSFEDPLVLNYDDGFLETLKEYRKVAAKSHLRVIGLDYMLRPSYDWRDCGLVRDLMFIEPNGDAYFCYLYSLVLGNIFREDPLKVWNSPKALAFRKQLATNMPPLMQCRCCNFARSDWQPEGEYARQGLDKRDITYSEVEV